MFKDNHHHRISKNLNISLRLASIFPIHLSYLIMQLCRRHSWLGQSTSRWCYQYCLLDKTNQCIPSYGGYDIALLSYSWSCKEYVPCIQSRATHSSTCFVSTFLMRCAWSDLHTLTSHFMCIFSNLWKKNCEHRWWRDDKNVHRLLHQVCNRIGWFWEKFM